MHFVLNIEQNASLKCIQFVAWEMRTAKLARHKRQVKFDQIHFSVYNKLLKTSNVLAYTLRKVYKDQFGQWKQFKWHSSSSTEARLHVELYWTIVLQYS